MHIATQFIICAVKNRQGQDMVEYAQLAGFVSVAAGAVLPGFSDGLSTLFSRMISVVSAAGA